MTGHEIINLVCDVGLLLIVLAVLVLVGCLFYLESKRMHQERMAEISNQNKK